MGALVILLVVLLNLSFVWAQQQTASDTSSGDIEKLMKQYKERIEEARKRLGITKTEGCQHIMQQLREIARRHNMLNMEEGRLLIKLYESGGFRYYQIDDKQCNVIAFTPIGTLKPPSPTSGAQIGERILTTQDFKFKADVNLFRVLFQLLMYGAGIFWVIRVARQFIEGDMAEAAIAFFQGFIIVATMYVLYQLMLRTA
jgi:hypothetical protein